MDDRAPSSVDGDGGEAGEGGRSGGQDTAGRNDPDEVWPDPASDGGFVVADDGGGEPGGGNGTSAGESGGDGGEQVIFSTDREEFFGETRCPSDVLFCEDFEDALDTSTWSYQVTNNGTALTLEGKYAARGKGALHAHVTSGPSIAFIRQQKTFPALAARMWGRVFFYLESVPSPFMHWTLIEATGPLDTLTAVRYGGIDNPVISANHFLFNYEKYPRPQGFNELAIDDQDVSGGRARQISRQTWHCVEWMFDRDAAEARFFWDGVERPTLHATGNVGGTAMQFPSFTTLDIGWSVYHAFSTSYEVWIDELAIDDTRIGCQR